MPRVSCHVDSMYGCTDEHEIGRISGSSEAIVLGHFLSLFDECLTPKLTLFNLSTDSVNYIKTNFICEILESFLYLISNNLEDLLQVTELKVS